MLLSLDGRSGGLPGPNPGYGGGPGPHQGYPAGGPTGGYGGGGYGPNFGGGYDGGDGYGTPMSPRQKGYDNRGDRFAGNQGAPMQVSESKLEVERNKNKTCKFLDV